jgi:hypothetical protein
LSCCRSTTSAPGPRPAPRWPAGRGVQGTPPTGCWCRWPTNARGRPPAGRRHEQSSPLRGPKPGVGLAVADPTDAPRRLRGPPSSIKGRFAIAARRTSAALTLEPLRPPSGSSVGKAKGPARPSVRTSRHVVLQDRSLYGYRGLPGQHPFPRLRRARRGTRTGRRPPPRPRRHNPLRPEERAMIRQLIKATQVRHEVKRITTSAAS